MGRGRRGKLGKLKEGGGLARKKVRNSQGKGEADKKESEANKRRNQRSPAERESKD